MFYPQEEYRHKERKKLLKHGTGAFCRFAIRADNIAGVYLLVSRGALLYIGQTCNLAQRFNDTRFGSYGFITPAACYEGGQSTNCKINHLVLKLFEAGNSVELFFMQTDKHKRIERELLRNISTPYNRV